MSEFNVGRFEDKATEEM